MIRIGGEMPELLYPLDDGGDELTQGWRPDDLVDRSDALRLSFEQVVNQWRQIRRCLSEDRFHVQLGGPVDGDSSRKKNREFLYSYGLWNKRDQRDLLLRMEPEDFCHAFRGNDGSLFYVFCLDAVLCKELGSSRPVRIYIKHNFPAPGTKDDIVISFHELERPIIKLFKD